MEFFNLYNHNFIRIAIGIPRVELCSPEKNAENIQKLMEKAADESCAAALFPELSLSGYSCEDLFHQQSLLQASREALLQLIDSTSHLPLVSIVGLPLQLEGFLFNCAAVFSQGQLLGLIPKTYLPTYMEFYEGRQFTPGTAIPPRRVSIGEFSDIPFGPHLLFQWKEQPLFKFAVEICEDLWAPIPPSSYAALAGATVIFNPSASNITVGKADYRRQLAAGQSARTITAYAYSAAGFGESTTDLAWDGHAIICENGSLLAESRRFSISPQLITADVDLERLSADRMKLSTFRKAAEIHREEVQKFRTVGFSLPLPRERKLPLQRTYERFPYVPSDPGKRDSRCWEVYQIQIQGLAQRLRSTGIRRAVIGISGGLDSTQALIVTAKTFDLLEIPRKEILAYTMPGFATSDRTLRQARELMEQIGCTAREIDIRPSCEQMFRDIGHPYADGEPVFDVTFENVQAGERTSHLFRLANYHRALVIGTGDLSELALGWCTYGVGDHMSHYNVNASVPKTLIQYLIRWVADRQELGEGTSEVLYKILESEISPELVPDRSGRGGESPAQKTEELIGPYELHDFFLYYTLRFGYTPQKIAFLTHTAWADPERGAWPHPLPNGKKNSYSISEIKRHLKTFLFRFFQTSQFKRSCLPNGPKVGSGGSLSPRGDYRAPSDSSASVWLRDWEEIPEG